MTPEAVTLLDIDTTMFDYKKVDQLCFPELARCLNTTPAGFEIADKTYMDSLSDVTEFNAEDYIIFLAEEFSAPITLVESVFFDPRFYEEGLYPDVPGALEELSQSSELGIYSQSYSPRYQQAKISGIRRYFSDKLIYILPNKLSSEVLAGLPHGAVIVDDTVRVVETLDRIENFSPVWINRFDDEVHPTIPTIRSLEELPAHLK